jgi:hypothetical protein
MDPTSLLLKQLTKLAEEDAEGRSYSPTRSVYVINVENISAENNWDYYVGYTGNTIEIRFQEHIDGYKTWKEFKKGRARPISLAYDLCSVYPKFHTTEAAKKAEGLVARALRDAGFNAYSDQINAI